MSNAKAYQALGELQASVHVPKGQTNKFGGYAYRSCEDILQAVKPHLNGAVILVSDEIKLIGDRFYIEATAKFVFGDTVIENKAFAREPAIKKGMDESQITGTASSYARKYALNGLLLIDDNKDADTMDNKLEGNCSASTVARRAKPSGDTLIGVMSEGNDINTVQFWRNLSQEQQQREWKTIDKETQKHLKALMAQHPVPMEQAS